MMALPRIIDYFLHELCHLHHHGEAFCNEIYKVLPDGFG